MRPGRAFPAHTTRDCTRFAMTQRFALIIVLTIVAGLWLDGQAYAWAQPVVSIWTWMLFGLLCWRADADHRRLWLVCLAWATFGEIVLALVWGLYEYRLGNLPLFVPPGHVLLFALGMWLTERLPASLPDAVPALGAGLVLSFAWLEADTISLLLFAFFLLCIRYGPSPRLYGTMFALALLMELYGTAMGNWTWALLVPGLPFTAANPPIAAGAFYCVLDWLAGLSMRRDDTAATVEAR
ncbi:MAG: hypothetical protein OJI74_04255 [Rhodanobacter thiooxydans]|nr:hypothetical protein [Rhodanobacter thiooxydans]